LKYLYNYILTNQMDIPMRNLAWCAYDNLRDYMACRNCTTTHNFANEAAFTKECRNNGYVVVNAAHNNNNVIIMIFAEDFDGAKKWASLQGVIVAHLRKIGVNITAEAPKSPPRTEIIVITEIEIPKIAMKSVHKWQLLNKAFNIRVYNHPYAIFAMNPFKHISYSPHTIVTKEEIDAFCKFYMIDTNSLPKIPVNNPQPIWLGAVIGDVIKIIGNSDTIGLRESYRVVVRAEVIKPPVKKKKHSVAQI
jgi:DNA-directed RNA polymerase subunit H (RpoH/RPB5)